MRTQLSEAFINGRVLGARLLAVHERRLLLVRPLLHVAVDGEDDHDECVHYHRGADDPDQRAAHLAPGLGTVDLVQELAVVRLYAACRAVSPRRAWHRLVVSVLAVVSLLAFDAVRLAEIDGVVPRWAGQTVQGTFHRLVLAHLAQLALVPSLLVGMRAFRTLGAERTRRVVAERTRHAFRAHAVNQCKAFMAREAAGAIEEGLVPNRTQLTVDAARLVTRLGFRTLPAEILALLCLVRSDGAGEALRVALVVERRVVPSGAVLAERAADSR